MYNFQFPIFVRTAAKGPAENKITKNERTRNSAMYVIRIIIINRERKRKQSACICLKIAGRRRRRINDIFEPFVYRHNIT